jgi:hypothetical protein
VDLGSTSYLGVDIVPEVIREDHRRYGGANRSFGCADLRHDPLPGADLVLCRDCLVHLSNRDALVALRNLLGSGASWFLPTTFPALQRNQDMASGTGWRPLNLTLAPFGLGPPHQVILEQEVDPLGNEKVLALWSAADLRRALEDASP